MIKKLSKEEISKMNKEELLDEFENIHEEVMKEREFGGSNKPEINLPDATGKQIKFIDL